HLYDKIRRGWFASFEGQSVVEISGL
ncbi:MAG: hypothetical protein H6Q05_5087, partial [Acidobacteria bacterium]|nr:hypothetical protein [Acidobacteriota bacterium]